MIKKYDDKIHSLISLIHMGQKIDTWKSWEEKFISYNQAIKP